MQTARLGTTDLVLSRIGLGTWAIGGGGWEFGWGPQDDSESIAAIHRGLDLGINWIDTAPAYGLGHCEEVVGKALATRSDRPFVATKCGRCWTEDRKLFPRLTRESVREEVENSLRRLHCDTIDLYQIHWPEPDDQIEEAWREIGEQVRIGKIRYAGVSNFSVSQMKRLQAIHPIASLQPPYSMLRRDIEAEVLPFCRDQGIGVIAYSPLQKGLLTGKVTAEWLAGLAIDDHRRRDPQFHEPKLGANLRLVAGLKRLADAKGCSVAELALAWTLAQPGVTAAIVGVRRPSQLDGTVGAGDLVLSAEELDELMQLLIQRERDV